MSIGSETDPSGLETLSALTDGEVDAAQAAGACNAWRSDARAQSAWHAYQLIGDVLRSEDLCSSATHDTAFLTALRARLADEPVVLAPEPALEPADEAVPFPARRLANAARNSRWSWMAPSAVAAGFVLVAGALLVTRAPTVPGAGADSVFARLGGGATQVSQTVNAPTLAASDTSIEPQSVVLTGKMLRDTRIDRYLSAHQQFAGTSALGVPSGFLRNAAAEAPTR
jgi:sigma-E factor negative regulatory protein RseA